VPLFTEEANWEHPANASKVVQCSNHFTTTRNETLVFILKQKIFYLKCGIHIIQNISLSICYKALLRLFLFEMIF